jgi:glycopeptide antibiotics resistance protein
MIHLVQIERVRNDCSVPLPAVLAIVGTALIGFIEETIQRWLPNKVYDIRDVSFNALAGIISVSAIVVLARSPTNLKEIQNISISRRKCDILIGAI